MTATDRFKVMLVNALERICILEEQLETAQQENALIMQELEQVKEVRAELNGLKESIDASS